MKVDARKHYKSLKDSLFSPYFLTYVKLLVHVILLTPAIFISWKISCTCYHTNCRTRTLTVCISIRLIFFPYGMIDRWNLFLTWMEIQTLLKGPCIRDGVSGQEGEGKWDTHVLKGEEGENWTGPIRKNAALCCKAKQTHLLFSPNFHEEKRKLCSFLSYPTSFKNGRENETF